MCIQTERDKVDSIFRSFGRVVNNSFIHFIRGCSILRSFLIEVDFVSANVSGSLFLDNSDDASGVDDLIFGSEESDDLLYGCFYIGERHDFIELLLRILFNNFNGF